MSSITAASVFEETAVDSCHCCNKPAQDYLKHLLEDHGFTVDRARMVMQKVLCTGGQDRQEGNIQQQEIEEAVNNNREELLKYGVPFAVPKNSNITINHYHIIASGSRDHSTVNKLTKSSRNNSAKSSSSTASKPAQIDAPEISVASSPGGAGAQANTQDLGLVDEAFEAWCKGRCSYQCPRQFCNKGFGESFSFWAHLRLSHGQLREQFCAENQEESYILASETLECKLCQQKILHDRVELDNHFKARHPGMTLEAYFLTYVSSATRDATGNASTTVEEVQDNQDDDDDDIVFICEIPAKETPNAPLVRVKQENAGTKRKAKRSGPTFQKVAATTKGANKAGRKADEKGVDKGEAVSDTQKIRQWNKSKLIKTEKKCQICAKQFSSRSKVSLETHVAKSHGLNLVQYINLYLEVNAWRQGCLFRCFYCPGKMYITSSYYELQRHIAGAHKGKNLTTHTKEFGNRYLESYLKCPFCKTSILHEYPTVQRHAKQHGESMDSFRLLVKKSLESDGRSRKPVNPTYACPPCQSEFTFQRGLIAHVKNKHKVDEIKGDDELKAFACHQMVNKYGKCRICNTVMVNTMVNLQIHLQLHGTTLEEYIEKYSGSTNQERSDQTAPETEAVENGSVDDPIFVACDSAGDDENPENPVAQKEGDVYGRENDEDEDEDWEVETSPDQDEDEVSFAAIQPDNRPASVATAARSNWHSKCTYKCYICTKINYETHSRDMLRHHIKAKHKVPLAQCDRDRIRIKVVYTKCAGCGDNVLHDYYSIREHRDKRHPNYAPGQLSNFQAVFLGTVN